MKHPSIKFWITSLSILAITGTLTGLSLPFTSLVKAQAQGQEAVTTPAYIKDPFNNAL